MCNLILLDSFYFTLARKSNSCLFELSKSNVVHEIFWSIKMMEDKSPNQHTTEICVKMYAGQSSFHEIQSYKIVLLNGHINGNLSSSITRCSYIRELFTLEFVQYLLYTHFTIQPNRTQMGSRQNKVACFAGGGLQTSNPKSEFSMRSSNWGGGGTLCN